MVFRFGGHFVVSGGSVQDDITAHCEAGRQGDQRDGGIAQRGPGHAAQRRTVRRPAGGSVFAAPDTRLPDEPFPAGFDLPLVERIHPSQVVQVLHLEQRSAGLLVPLDRFEQALCLLGRQSSFEVCRGQGFYRVVSVHFPVCLASLGRPFILQTILNGFLLTGSVRYFAWKREKSENLPAENQPAAQRQDSRQRAAEQFQRLVQLSLDRALRNAEFRRYVAAFAAVEVCSPENLAAAVGQLVDFEIDGP